MTCADSGAEAIAAFHKNDYDLIFMDHMMPVMDGVEAMQRLRKMPGGSHAVIIALTANALSGASAEYKALGFQDFLAKPIEPRVMDELLKHYLPKELIGAAGEPVTSAALQDEDVLEYAAGRPDSGDAEETPESLGSVMDRLRQIPNLDVNKGLGYCMESEEFYIEMIETFIKGSKIQVLEEKFREKDWENYRITVHSVKSNSLTLGAEQLSEEAKALEMALKEDRPSFVEENHGKFCLNYQNFLRACEACMK